MRKFFEVAVGVPVGILMTLVILRTVIVLSWCIVDLFR